MPDDDNVIPFPKGQFEKNHNERESALDSLPIRTKRERAKCDHERHGSWVSVSDRRVTCRGCGVELDPISVLERLAARRESLVVQGRMLRNERDHLSAEVEKLKRAEANAKSRIRTARKRVVAGEADALEAAAEHAANSETVVGWEGLPEGSKDRWRKVSFAAVEGYFGSVARDQRTA